VIDGGRYRLRSPGDLQVFRGRDSRVRVAPVTGIRWRGSRAGAAKIRRWGAIIGRENG